MENSSLIFAADSLSIRLECGVVMLSAIYAAMADSNSTADSFTEAIYAAEFYFRQVQKELEAAAQIARECQKAGREAA